MTPEPPIFFSSLRKAAKRTITILRGGDDLSRFIRSRLATELERSLEQDQTSEILALLESKSALMAELLSALEEAAKFIDESPVAAAALRKQVHNALSNGKPDHD